jgi:hypothetical protein
VAVELGCHIKQVQSLRKRKHFNDLLDLRTGAAQTYADRWEQIRQRQLDMAGSALDTIEEAIDDRDEQGNVTQTALRAAEGLIKSLEKGVAKESGGGSKELQSFMKRLEDIAVKEAEASVSACRAGGGGGNTTSAVPTVCRGTAADSDAARGCGCQTCPSAQWWMTSCPTPTTPRPRAV